MPPTSTLGSRPPCANTHPVSDVVVGLPCVPAMTIERAPQRKCSRIASEGRRPHAAAHMTERTPDNPGPGKIAEQPATPRAPGHVRFGCGAVGPLADAGGAGTPETSSRPPLRPLPIEPIRSLPHFV